MKPIEPSSIVSVPIRPVIVSTSLAGTVELRLPILHGGIMSLAQVAWRRGDPLETTDVMRDPAVVAENAILSQPARRSESLPE